MNQYIFTPTGFYPDTQEKETLEKRYETLYHMGFSKRSKEMSSSELFLYELSETFFQCLTEMPELELTREATHVAPDEEHLEHLLSSVPYAIGAEYIDRKWVVGVFSQLEQIFQREISGYKGSVELYLTEQNQKLHVPERIFLHLVIVVLPEPCGRGVGSDCRTGRKWGDVSCSAFYRERGISVSA